MARIPLTSGFVLAPEGVHVFKITEVKYDEDFGKLEISMVTSQGIKHTERFKLLDGNNQPNEKALNAFSYFAKTALNRYDADEIDHTELVGHYIRAEVIHSQIPSNKDPNKMMTFANLGDKSPADGFDDAPAEAAQTAAPAPAATPPATAKPLDLDKLLG